MIIVLHFLTFDFLVIKANHTPKENYRRASERYTRTQVSLTLR